MEDMIYDIQIREGVSKKNGKPWRAFFLTVTPPREYGRPVMFAVFPRSYEWHALGLPSPYDDDKQSNAVRG